MLCFTRFINSTTSSVISILVDESRIFSDVLQNDTTPYAALNVGTREITILQNNNKLLLKSDISLPPIDYATIVIKNNDINIIPS